jgi:hypothetical protein
MKLPKLACLCLLLCCNAAMARQTASWTQLEFEQRAFWLTARSLVSLQPVDSAGATWQLSSQSSIAKNSEAVTVQFDHATGQSQLRERTSRGKNQRYKSWSYQPGTIIRLRRAPEANSADNPQQWPLQSRRELPYPTLPAVGGILVDPTLLLWLAADALDSGTSPVSFDTHTDLNFYQVTATAQPAQMRGFDVDLPGDSQRRVIPVKLRVLPLGTAIDEPDFNLLGLSGEITIYYDAATRVPLLLEGDAPRIGNAAIELKRVTLREVAM